MTGLMYSNMTDKLVTRASLAQLETPTPRGPRHNPYPFSEFAEEVVNSLVATGYRIIDEEYAVTKDHDRCFALLEVEPENAVLGHDWNLTVGWRGAHDQEFARGVTLGSRVMVCSNLCFHGNLGTWKTRQTNNVGDRIPGMIQEAINELPEAAGTLADDFDAYRLKKLTVEEGDHHLVRMYRDGALSGAQLGRAALEWVTPTFPAHAEDGFTAWRLFNAATQALKPTGTSGDQITLQQRSEKVHKAINDTL